MKLVSVSLVRRHASPNLVDERVTIYIYSRFFTQGTAIVSQTEDWVLRLYQLRNRRKGIGDEVKGVC